MHSAVLAREQEGFATVWALLLHPASSVPHRCLPLHPSPHSPAAHPSGTCSSTPKAATSPTTSPSSSALPTTTSCSQGGRTLHRQAHPLGASAPRTTLPLRAVSSAHAPHAPRTSRDLAPRHLKKPAPPSAPPSAVHHLGGQRRPQEVKVQRHAAPLLQEGARLGLEEVHGAVQGGCCSYWRAPTLFEVHPR